MNQPPQMVKRKIGAVHIIDLVGEFVGPWALKGREEIALFIRNHKTRNLLVNLRGLSTVDSLGVKAVTGNISSVERGGLVVGNLSVMEMFARVGERENIKLFRSEEEIIDYFGQDLVKWEEKTYEEKRKFQRLKTALPLEFSYKDEQRERVFFRAVVTDLSEGGLLAEYLDLDRESFGKLKLNPYGIREMDLKIKLPEEEPVLARGRVVRTVLEADQVGIGVEFDEIKPSDVKRISEFLKGA